MLFVDGVDPADIRQGFIKNAYFICSVSAISEYPQRIERLFSATTSNANSPAYSISLFDAGQWKVVTIDDYLPTIMNPSRVERLIGATSLQDELWVSLIEKAYAKVYGGYYHIGTGGDPRFCLTDLTGAPSEMIRTENYLVNPTSFWDILEAADKSKFIMSCGSKFDEDLKSIYKDAFTTWKDNTEYAEGKSFMNEFLGIVPGHMYTLLNCVIKQGKKYVEMRNPWGSSEWKGDGGDYSTFKKKLVSDQKKKSNFLADNFKKSKDTLTNIKGFGSLTSGAKGLVNANIQGFEDFIDSKDKQMDNRDQDLLFQKEDDGKFLMPFIHFLNIFKQVTICYYNDESKTTSISDRLLPNTLQSYEIEIVTEGQYYFMVSQEDHRKTQLFECNLNSLIIYS